MEQSTDMGIWLGRGQAFGFVARRCAAAHAECLKRIRDAEAYKSLGCTWEDFCRQHLGVSRSRADEIIRQLDEFGAAYFQLAEIMQISTDSYRRISGAVQGEALEIGGELVPIVPENAARIKEAVRAWQKEGERAKAILAKVQALHPSITSLKIRLDSCFDEMFALATGPRDLGESAALHALARYSLSKAKRILRSLTHAPA